MAANIFGRYVWLVDILRRHKRLTFEQINELWKNSGLSSGADDDLPLRTFHNHRKAIFDVFSIDIICDPKDKYVYYIDHPEDLEENAFHNWLIDSYATLNHVKADEKSMKLKNRIIYENTPSGHEHLTPSLRLCVKTARWKSPIKASAKITQIHLKLNPCVKVFNRRWYVVANSTYDNKVRTYGLDRISNVNITENSFKLPQYFDANKYFDGCCGIISDKNIPIERVVIKVYDYARKYLETLPLHSSQKEIGSDDESTTYQYNVRPTYDFLQSILCQADQIEVLEPQWVRDEMHRFAENILSYYKNDKK